MENVIHTVPQSAIPALYKAAAVSVIALSIAGIGAMTGYLPVKKADAPLAVVGAAANAVPAPSLPPVSAAPSVTTAPEASQPTPSVVRTPAVEHRPRVIKTSSRQFDEPTSRASQVSTHPVAVSASGSDSVPYPQTYPQSTPQSYPQTYPQSQPSSQTARIPQDYPQPYPQVAQANTQPRAVCNTCGTIEGVREIEKAGEGSGLGMAGGALGGAVLGKQFGNGRGRDALAILGAIGGGFAGHQVEKNVRTVKSYEVQVRMEDGSLRSIPSATQPNWRSGDRVRVEGGAISLNYS